MISVMRTEPKLFGSCAIRFKDYSQLCLKIVSGFIPKHPDPPLSSGCVLFFFLLKPWVTNSFLFFKQRNYVSQIMPFCQTDVTKQDHYHLKSFLIFCQFLVGKRLGDNFKFKASKFWHHPK